METDNEGKCDNCGAELAGDEEHERITPEDGLPIEYDGKYLCSRCYRQLRKSGYHG